MTEQLNNIERRAHNFYAAETYLGFPILNPDGNPRLYHFAKKNDLINFLDEKVKPNFKRFRVTGYQALLFGKRRNWRPAPLIKEINRVSLEIKKALYDLRAIEDRKTQGVKIYLKWNYGQGVYNHLLPNPLKISDILKALYHYGQLLTAEKPNFLPNIILDVQITAAHNLSDYASGNNCMTKYFITALDFNALIIEK